MKRPSCSPARTPGARAAALLSIAALLTAASLAGCKNNPSTTSSHTATVAPAEPITATPVLRTAPAEVTLASVLGSVPGARMSPLVPPMNDTRTTPPTRIAIQYDAEHLYVACIGQNAAPGAATTLSIWLDNTEQGNGTEYFELALNPGASGAQAVRGAVWHRSTQAPTPRPDGTPNFGHPVSHVPDTTVAGLRTQTGRSTLEGQPAWTLVAAIPVKSLPIPLRASPGPKKKWRLNVIRQDAVPGQSARQTLQANYSPVYLNAQAMMPYRMAVLQFAEPGPAPGARAAN